MTINAPHGQKMKEQFMREEDKEKFLKIIGDAMAVYAKDASKGVLSVFWECCKGYDIEQVDKAILAHCKRSKFAPRVADITEILEGTVADRVALAWGKVFGAMSSVGAYTDIVFDDAAIHAAVEDLGGWPKICRTEGKDLGFMQHRFGVSYAAYAGRETFNYPRRLSGDRSPDHEYARKGLPAPKAAIVGKREQCALVYRGGVQAGKTQIGYLASLTAMAANAPKIELEEAA